MTARELYEEARRMFPHAGSVFADVSVQDTAVLGKGLLEVWTASASSAKPGQPVVHDIATGWGTTPEECLRNLREDGERRAREGKK